MDMKKINYMLEINIFEKSSHKIGCPEGCFLRVGCPKSPAG